MGRFGDQGGIWRMNADGSDRRLIGDALDASYLEIAPDGRTVYYTSSRQGPSSTWRIPIEGGTPTLVMSQFDRAAVSPDGRLLAGVLRAESSLSLAVVELADGGVRQTFSGPRFRRCRAVPCSGRQTGRACSSRRPSG
ncbi:MAG TPA: hypothetical protein VMO26_17610 [Vicinamibacterales bacterium]|nr:hypothetical protein [Vicinamibacterales bacterium]